jgi:phosphohistidine phosphatase
MPRSSDGLLRHLFVLRHGKAAAEPPQGGRDRDRELTSRGRRDAQALGVALASRRLDGLEGITPPERVVCSSAVRTYQTAALVVDSLAGRVPVDAYGALYGADPTTLLTYAREIDDSAESALLVGHNPGMFELALDLVDSVGGSDSPRRKLEEQGFPPCALAVVALPVREWADIEPTGGRLVGAFTPPY